MATPFPHPWFDRHEPEVELAYVGMARDEARAAAISNGITQVRVLEVPTPPGTEWTADLRPNRLNLMIVEGRVVRAAFF
jgi:hypothetical protein